MKFIYSSLGFTLFFPVVFGNAECQYYQGACVCTAEYCDTFPKFPERLLKDEVFTIVSTKSGKRFAMEKNYFKPICSGSESGDSCYPNKVKERAVTVEINSNRVSHLIKGFGGAMTDSAISNMKLLKPEVKSKLMDSYYGQDGIEYTITRVPMASCDFSLESYTYNNQADNFNMSEFTINMDVKSEKIQYIKDAVEIASSANNNLALFASPWTPPPWMKTNNDYVGGELNGEPGGKYYKAWAKYFSSFLTEYKNHGIEFWGVTNQNEPYQNPRWESCSFSPENTRDFIKLDLGPELTSTHPNVKILTHDDQKPSLHKTANAIMEDPEAAKYVHGFGVHWYAQVNGLLGWGYNYIKNIKEKYPDKIILGTEACEGFLAGFFKLNPISLGDWSRGERYSRDIMADVSGGAAGWVDWNIVLNMEGGPNHANNNVDSPILADTGTGEKFYKQPMYYHLGHYSKFIKPESNVIGVDLNYSGLFSSFNRVHVIAVTNPKRQNVVVVLNTNIFGKVIYIKDINTNRILRFESEPHSIQTFVY